MVRNPQATEFYNYLKRRTKLFLDKIIDEVDVDKQLKEIDEFLLSSLKVKTYHGEKGEEALAIKGFENTCVVLRQYNVSSNPKNLSTLGYYQALEVVRQIIKKKSK